MLQMHLQHLELSDQTETRDLEAKPSRTGSGSYQRELWGIRASSLILPHPLVRRFQFLKHAESKLFLESSHMPRVCSYPLFSPLSPSAPPFWMVAHWKVQGTHSLKLVHAPFQTSPNSLRLCWMNALKVEASCCCREGERPLVSPPVALCDLGQMPYPIGPQFPQL